MITARTRKHSASPLLESRASSRSVARSPWLTQSLELQADNPDVVVLDWQLPDTDGVEGIGRIKAMRPSTTIMLISGHAATSLERLATSAGASAVLPKESSIADIANTIRRCAIGEVITGSSRVSRPVVPVSLTPRETEILWLLAKGKDAPRIASELFISVHTVRGYVKDLRHKFSARSQLEVVALAREQGSAALLIQQPRQGHPKRRAASIAVDTDHAAAVELRKATNQEQPDPRAGSINRRAADIRLEDRFFQNVGNAVAIVLDRQIAPASVSSAGSSSTETQTVDPTACDERVGDQVRNHPLDKCGVGRHDAVAGTRANDDRVGRHMVTLQLATRCTSSFSRRSARAAGDQTGGRSLRRNQVAEHALSASRLCKEPAGRTRLAPPHVRGRHSPRGARQGCGWPPMVCVGHATAPSSAPSSPGTRVTILPLTVATARAARAPR